MQTLKCGCIAFDENHLRPLITYSSPSRTMDVSMFVASEDATAGSVIKNAEATFPSSIGFSHFSFNAGEAYFANTSILPVSGALQLNISDDHGIRPINSAKGAYSKLVKPAVDSL